MKFEIISISSLLLLCLQCGASLADDRTAQTTSDSLRSASVTELNQSDGQLNRLQAAGSQVKWRVTATGGLVSQSGNFLLGGTIGESFVGPNVATIYSVNQGFWQRFDKIGCCIGTTGNVNGSASETPDLSDLSLLIAYLTQTPRPVLPCPPEANINAVDGIDLSDLSLLIAFLTQTPRPVLPECT